MQNPSQDIHHIPDPLTVNQFYLGDRIELMSKIKKNSIDLIITSPPYNVGIQYKNHHDTMNYKTYLSFLEETWQMSYQVLKTGGRIAINVPSITYDGNYMSLYADVIQQMKNLKFIMRGDILWYKQVISKRTAWGSWKSPSNPYVVQPYEFLLVFSKETKQHKGDPSKADITREEFIEFSNSFWSIKPETALSKKHPAPFPKELVYRLIKFYTYQDDIVLDMFGGSGTVALVSKENQRDFIYMDNCKEYLNFAKQRVTSTLF